MKMNLGKTVAALVPALAIGAAGAQVLLIEAPGSETVLQPSEAPIVFVDTTTTEALIASERAPARAVVINEAYRTEVPGIGLPRSVTPRSGEDSGEEIATRGAPVDVRAGLSPAYTTDQSPGL
jgi:hypothetical protein